ncbi:MAG: hypothetical protein IKG71_01270 [Firmicutes bacterium]|nr:hypothetical protein [Bacillota bacterium]
MTEEQYERESNFSLAMAVIRALQKKGLLTASEFEKIREKLICRFNPIWGHLPCVQEL